MPLPPLIRPQVNAFPTLDTAIWLLHLRWVAVAGQLLTMAVVAVGFDIVLPTWQLISLIGITATTNTAYAWWLSKLHGSGLQRTERLTNDQVVPMLMLSDIVVLTGMLYLSAGIANPFSLFYFVNIAVAGAIITPAWAWIIWATTVGSVALLLSRSQPIEVLSASSLLAASELPARWTIPKLGFMVSFATCSGVITYFITVLTGELRQRETALKEAEEERIRSRQLEGLATLAAGAGHELATPLTTIAVVASELSRALEKLEVPQTVSNDVALIRSELNRCREILDRMTSAAGDAAGERLRDVNLEELIDETLLGLREPERIQVSIAAEVKGIRKLLPVQAVAQAIRNLLQNALDASEDGAVVQLQAIMDDEHWRISVIDKGSGMPADVLQRIGEPFFTTKEPGRGMGLGLHLTQNVIRRLDGELKFTSEVGQGTNAVITLPLTRD